MGQMAGRLYPRRLSHTFPLILPPLEGVGFWETPAIAGASLAHWMCSYEQQPDLIPAGSPVDPRLGPDRGPLALSNRYSCLACLGETTEILVGDLPGFVPWKLYPLCWGETKVRTPERFYPAEDSSPEPPEPFLIKVPTTL